MKQIVKTGQNMQTIKKFTFLQGKVLALVAILLILSCQATLPPSFGNAHSFHPLPDTVVGAHCPWEVRLNTVFNRVPPVITEIVCLSPHSVCGGNANFKVWLGFLILIK